MTKYFLDTEFDEDGRVINLISLALVCEDGREYYAISTEFDPNACNDWVKTNVLPKLPPQALSPQFSWQAADGEVVTSWLWKPRAAIASEILDFVGITRQLRGLFGQSIPSDQAKPEFWAHYADYDWVALCQLYGPMVALPKGMPMYCNDIKQLEVELNNPQLPPQSGSQHDALEDARWNHVAWMFLDGLKQKQGVSSSVTAQGAIA